MKKLFILAIISISFFQHGCSELDDDGSTNANAVLIRVKNVSQFDYSNMVVNTSGSEHNYGNISSGQLSDYQKFDFAYSYAFVELEINAETYTIQPIDYVGEAKLTPGNYTYEIGADDSAEQYGRLSITLVQD